MRGRAVLSHVCHATVTLRSNRVALEKRKGRPFLDAPLSGLGLPRIRGQPASTSYFDARTKKLLVAVPTCVSVVLPKVIVLVNAPPS